MDEVSILHITFKKLRLRKNNRESKNMRKNTLSFFLISHRQRITEITRKIERIKLIGINNVIFVIISFFSSFFFSPLLFLLTISYFLSLFQSILFYLYFVRCAFILRTVFRCLLNNVIDDFVCNIYLYKFHCRQ